MAVRLSPPKATHLHIHTHVTDRHTHTQTLTHTHTHQSAAANFAVYLAGLILQTNMGSMCVQLAALLAPNQDIAFVIAAGRSCWMMFLP